uniref:Uncharacterized protein n=1 Tax=Strigamia maritima TaxID=126957 RepID=T1IU00_STRMM
MMLLTSNWKAILERYTAHRNKSLMQETFESDIDRDLATLIHCISDLRLQPHVKMVALIGPCINLIVCVQTKAQAESEEQDFCEIRICNNGVCINDSKHGITQRRGTHIGN